MNSFIERDKIIALDKSEFTYEIRFLEQQDLQNILELQNLIVSHLINPEIFQTNDEKFIINIFHTQEEIIGIFIQQELIAYLMVDIPSKEEDNLGIDIAVPHNELDKVAHLDNVVVHPIFRGFSFQLKLQSHAINIIKNKGYYHICSTVSPYNYPSLYNLLQSGLFIKALKPKYGGKIRYVCHQNMKKISEIQTNSVIPVMNTDFDQQKALLQQDYCGYRIEKQQNEIFIVNYGRPKRVVPK